MPPRAEYLLGLSHHDALAPGAQAAPGMREGEATAVYHLPPQLPEHSTRQGWPTAAAALAGPGAEAPTVSVAWGLHY